MNTGEIITLSLNKIHDENEKLKETVCELEKQNRQLRTMLEEAKSRGYISHREWRNP